MAIKFQYNKTSLQQLEKQLKVRVRTLPIIKNKESALRMEVKRCKGDAAALDARLEKEIQAYEAMFALWNEFDASLIKVSDVHLGVKKIAGVRVPLLENVDFEIRPYSLFNAPKWYADGLHLLKSLAHTAIEREFTVAKLNLLEHAQSILITRNLYFLKKIHLLGGLFTRMFQQVQLGHGKLPFNGRVCQFLEQMQPVCIPFGRIEQTVRAYLEIYILEQRHSYTGNLLHT